MPLDIANAIAIDGYFVINEYLPNSTGITPFASLGEVARLRGLDEVQVLIPHKIEDSSPNTYSGNFGIQEFPLHTDLAHWFLPPRYFGLRCVVGSKYVSTNLVDVRDLMSIVSRHDLMRALVRPRRPLRGGRPLLRLLSYSNCGGELFRWDSLFVVSATKDSKAVCDSVAEGLASLERKEIYLENPGDTVIIDNWRMLHGRSQIFGTNGDRQIERAYFGAVK